ncbi:hypothetical protein HYC85_017480 [Camellia sinensis]|uniref:non-specific serine/threonine protein kinase n=1 Tax=Camellia sinensis TaxID=4442 RepID=A0A7J7GRK1_CAMSI|nr:hypothetical protein HYC85_017480 [Camellia sinensis]
MSDLDDEASQTPQCGPIIRGHMASKTKIYFAMEYVRGGELFNKVAKGRLKEDAARKYFQQLVAAVDFCHSRGVYHRDLKPKNLLLDEHGNLKVVGKISLNLLHLDRSNFEQIIQSKQVQFILFAQKIVPTKVSDFGLSALHESRRARRPPPHNIRDPSLCCHRSHQQERLRRREGIYLVLWGCPLCPLSRRVQAPSMVPTRGPKASLKNSRSESMHKNHNEHDNTPRNLLDFNKAFESDSEIIEKKIREATTSSMIMRPTCMNAYDIISLSQGFDLSGLFENDNDQKFKARFTTTKPASVIVSKLEEIAITESFKVKKRNGTLCWKIFTVFK